MPSRKLRLPIGLTVAEIRSVVGNPTPRCFEILLPAALSDADGCRFRLFERREREAIEALGGVLYEGVAAGVESLAASVSLSIFVSNCLEWYLDVFLGFSGLRPRCFAGWDCHGSSGQGKVGMFERLAERHDLGRLPSTSATRKATRDAAARGRAGLRLRALRIRRSLRAVPVAFDSFDELVAHFLAERIGRFSRPFAEHGPCSDVHGRLSIERGVSAGNVV